MMMIITFSQVHSVFSTRYNDDNDDDDDDDDDVSKGYQGLPRPTRSKRIPGEVFWRHENSRKSERVGAARAEL